jgi:serine protease AprX
MAGTKIWAVVLTWFISFPASSQDNRYMVFFKDKTGSPFTVAQPLSFLSQKAIDRRLKQGLDINPQDLPVYEGYVDGVRNAGAKCLYTTRWFNGVLFQCDAALLPDLQSLTFVDHIEYVAPKSASGGRKSYNLRRKNNRTGFETETQLNMIGLDRMQEAGYTGEGITIAVLDSGFPGVDLYPPFQPVFSEARFDASVSFDFVHDSKAIFQYDGHGTEVLSVIAGSVPDAFTGGAYKANFQLYITEDVPTEYRIEEYNWVFAAERADSAGVDIIHSSLGYYDFDDAGMNYSVDEMDGKTAVITRAAQMAADRGILVVASAGNEGNIPSWRIITAPADARDVLAVGNVNSSLNKSGSSSIGPTADNRIKPDVAALGVNVRVINENGQVSTASGTSLSAPLITSLAAGIWQRYPDLSNKEVIDLIKLTASQAGHPDNLLGFGIPNFEAVVNYKEHSPQTNMFEIFPNPLIDDTLTIRPFDPNLIDSCQIEIISAQGQIVSRNTAHFSWLQRISKTDMSGLSAGTYYIRVFSDQRHFTFRVVKL